MEAQKRSVQNLNNKLRNGTRQDVSYYYSPIGSHIRFSIDTNYRPR